MAIIGRLACPWCGFAGAHVKRSEGKRPYHHCPDCGSMTHTKNGHQETLLLAKMEAATGYVPEPPGATVPIIVRGGAKPAEVQPPAATPAAPERKASWIDQLMKS